MQVKNKDVKRLLEKYREIALLGQVNSVLSWDLNVNLPPAAAEDRAAQSAFLTKLVTQRWLDPDFKFLFEKAKVQTKLTLEEKATLRNLEHSAKYYFRVPPELIIKFSEETSRAFMIWQRAKKENRFKDFLPSLKKIIKLNQLIAQHLGYQDNPYDALLDLYEPGLTTRSCQRLFSTLIPELITLLKQTKSNPKFQIKSDLINADLIYPQPDQEKLARFLLHKLNYNFSAGRQDLSSHPFTTVLGSSDVRVTNRYQPNNFIDSLTVALHEGGHALYEQGIKAEYALTPLAGGVSLGIHESQSRFWENQIGRSREFIHILTPILHAFYPAQLSQVGEDTLFTLFNQVAPGPIRVEADEVSYNLHIALRFELEEALINNRLKPQDLPAAWRAKMKKYLGIVPSTDREGVLQDVHWSYGSFGYFPTYTLGNLYAAQFTATLNRELKLTELVGNADFGTILSWLRTNIHQHGSLYWPAELLQKVTSQAFSPKFFLQYLQKKYR